MPNMLETIKQVAVQAVEASNPAAVCFGTVKSTDPLKIAVDQKFTLESIQLIIPKSLTDYEIEMTVDHLTETASEHYHAYQGTKTFLIKNALAVNDRVILIRLQGGQKYLILDRVVES